MFVDINGQKLHVVSFGAGPRTVLAVGGWIGSWELWEQPFELLSRDWRCVSYDHRGSGESPAHPDSITPETLVADLFGVMDLLEIDTCLLAGESLGALTVLEAVRRAPERFEGLILVDGAPGVSRETVGRLVDGTKVDFPATVAAFVDACVPGSDSEHLRRWGRNLLSRAEPAAAARLLEGFLDHPSSLDEIDIPALVIHSSDDEIVSIEVGRWMASQLRQATLVELAGAGHVPTVTRPREVVDAIRARFAG